jgi:chorismate mutase / prephenate dehydrogenase
MDPAAIAGRRERIGAIDRQILALMAERVRLAREIGGAKRDVGAATLDPGQEATVVRRAVAHARELGLPEEPLRQIFWILVGLCRDAQLEDRR